MFKTLGMSEFWSLYRIKASEGQSHIASFVADCGENHETTANFNSRHVGTVHPRLSLKGTHRYGARTCSSIALHPEHPPRLHLDLLFCRQGGVPEHREYQMYLLVPLQKDEAKILEMAADKSLTDKRKKDSKLLLNVLEEEKLATVLGVQVAKLEEAKSYPLTFKIFV